MIDVVAGAEKEKSPSKPELATDGAKPIVFLDRVPMAMLLPVRRIRVDLHALGPASVERLERR